MLAYTFIDPKEQIDSEDFKFVESFLKATGRTQIGWHYITDLVWIYSQVKQWPPNLTVLDAGGGRNGPTQFLLAELGFHVINVDMILSDTPIAYNSRYQTKLETLPSFVPTSYKELLCSSQSKSASANLKKWVKETPVYKVWSSQKYAAVHERWRSAAGLSDISLGQIQWCVGNLCHMPEIASASFDAVVSLSSLEHIPKEHLDKALAEIRRVLKSDSRWAVTTSGTEQLSTWFHEPSQGYCFSVSDLESRFGACSLNSQEPEKILEKYRQCAYLRDNLAEFYKKSGKFGMPWGKWNPQYIPVGLSR